MTTSIDFQEQSLQENGAIAAIRDYWNEHVHDLEIATHPVGSPDFFRELDEYRFEKLRYLPKVVDFTRYRGKTLLEVGCGVGIDLIRFARGGAIVSGIDLAEVSIKLAAQYFEHEGLEANLEVMNGEAMTFDAATFDVVYAHGVLQYTDNAANMIDEICRVLKPGGEAIIMVYNRYSWLNALSKLMNVELEHEDAPALRKYTVTEFKRLLKPFIEVRIVPERFPVESRLHHGLKGTLYNRLFVGAFNALPRSLVRPLGWHLMAFVRKDD